MSRTTFPVTVLVEKAQLEQLDRAARDGFRSRARHLAMLIKNALDHASPDTVVSTSADVDVGRGTPK